MTPATPLLRLDDVVSAYGRVTALHGVSISVPEGSIVALLGANGAGKSTVLRTVSGLLRLRSGSITYAGEDLGNVRAYQRVGLGIAHVPENRGIFPDLTVAENLDLGGYAGRRGDSGERINEVCELFPILRDRMKQNGGTLSGGEQQMLAIGRALIGRPRLLMIDECSLGLAPMIVETIFQVIDRINREGVTVVLVEQNTRKALEHAHTAYVLDVGTVVLSGPTKELRSNAALKNVYLGM